ncbi:pseudouridine synthase [Dasania sp. GY-MA-18]|uniref:Dual-specificity RNA pseudouridine synthase RluA n=1 Tax=Dasania phycosphaerae TaxID=2950436 RepID=A0A9J6RHN7_9GAMM|nr:MULTISPECIES: pseudouridine synthase [Dasania]MCR8921421.1 pseudouridine synthase [Dasania sp. GY-MA-18]MCZ0863849.1 pseudouridine synthase [Dasania phycosphaerae]MCZ0867577.1 pseudouridine synthase [Dasania phycosphaerae]
MTGRDFIAPPCTEDIHILWQDDQCLLVNKPAGLLSVPGRHPANRDCLISRVQEQYPSARIVHRLDMDTSGIMVLALNADSHRQLSRQFEQRLTHKCYIAEVFGLVAKDKGSIELPIITDWPNRPLQKIDHEQGKAALTHYQVLSRNPTRNSSRVLLTPITGRSHQLRIHLAEIGHPILGCDFYAHQQARALSPRLLLHAETLHFHHPVSDEVIKGYSPCPF